MKKRIVKTVLPLMAFLLATAFAFATDQKSSEEEALVNEYIFQDGQCVSISRGCNNLSSTPCTYKVNLEQFQVYSVNNGTYCSVEMTHRP